jgi:hypothetical protein
MTETTAAGSRLAEGAAAADDISIRPFDVDIPDEALDDLRRRIAAARWPSKELAPLGSDPLATPPADPRRQHAVSWIATALR